MFKNGPVNELIFTKAFVNRVFLQFLSKFMIKTKQNCGKKIVFR